MVSGKEVADKLLGELHQEIIAQDLKPKLAIILAGDNSSSKTYVEKKLETASKIGIEAQKFEFSDQQSVECADRINQLNRDPSVHGIIIQYPVYPNWNFDGLVYRVATEKDVDGFKPYSPFMGATALGVWEMLGAFAKEENYPTTKAFLEDKKITVLGRGRTAGGPIARLLKAEGFDPLIIHSQTENPDEKIKNSDVVISATGRKHIVNGSNIKEGAYVIGVGVGKENGKTFGDIDEESVAKKAKLYCPTIGGIGPLTVACLLKNVVQSAHGFNGQSQTAG